MQRSARELWWAAAAITAITALYLVVTSRLQAVPAASSLFGHGIGIVGFLLMLATETLYSLRKRSRQARWGRTASWLRFHIFTGLVGPYMVLLHTSWKFNQLAGIVMLLTVIVVASGFIGRYIYTAVPRTADGVALAREQLEAEIAIAEAELQSWLAQRPVSEPGVGFTDDVARRASKPVAHGVGPPTRRVEIPLAVASRDGAGGCYCARPSRPVGEARGAAAAVAASGGVAGHDPPDVGDLAQRAHSARYGAFHGGLCACWRDTVLRLVVALRGACNAWTSPWLYLWCWHYCGPGYIAPHRSFRCRARG